MSDKNGSEGRIQWSRFFKKLSPYMIQKGLLYLKHYGPREFWIRLHERFEPEEIPYGPWYAAYVPDQTVLDKQRKKKFAYAPLISVVVPAYRTPELFLRQMIDRKCRKKLLKAVFHFCKIESRDQIEYTFFLNTEK